MATNINTEVKGISRREFLTYLWGASAALLIAEAGGAAVWFALPHHGPEAQYGIYHINPSILPDIQATPVPFRDGALWLSNTSSGLLALSMVCVHRMDALVKWVDVTHRFECPACGSKYSLDGHHLSGPVTGPAPRDLDRFVIEVTTPNGTLKTPSDGGPVNIEGAKSIIINTNQKILGQPSPRV